VQQKLHVFPDDHKSTWFLPQSVNRWAIFYILEDVQVKVLFCAIGIFVSLISFSHKGVAAELVTNGGFETGTFAPWEALNVTTNVWYNWRITAATCDACLDQWTRGTSPHGGTRSAWNGWAAGNPVPDAFRLRQTVTIPNNPGELVALRWWDRLQWNLAYQSGSTLPQYMVVNVLNATTNAVLAEKYRFTAPAASQGPSNLGPGQGWVQRAANLTAFKGQTVKIEFMCTVAQNTMGPGICEFDDISLVNAVPSAAEVSVSGRVTTSDGRGISGAIVSMTDAAGGARTARTSPFGYYQFDGVESGSTYVVMISQKRYLFAESPRVITVSDSLSNVDFVASP
jgi:hypothetical protein